MPRKGTETFPAVLASPGHPVYLEMRCPGRGRKLALEGFCVFDIVFGNEMPRKGTETNFPYINRFHICYLEMRCPGRGRKRFNIFFYIPHLLKFGNEMPRKGTETHFGFFVQLIADLEMRCPGRGRKRKLLILAYFQYRIWK